MSIIYLVRHGQTSFQGTRYDHLTENGRQQARILGEFFAMTNRSFDACFTGALERQKETAAIILKSMKTKMAEPLVVPGLDEHDTGAIIRAQIPELSKTDPSFSDAAASISNDPQSFKRVLEASLLRWAGGGRQSAGVETWAEFTGRVRSGLQSVAASCGYGKKALVVSSGGPIGAAMQWALGLDAERAVRLAWRVRNASVSLFRITTEGAELFAFNSIAHLEAQNDPSLLTVL